jgi:hypothetical protein
MADFLGFASGMFPNIPEAKDEKDDIQLSNEWLRALYFSSI